MAEYIERKAAINKLEIIYDLARTDQKAPISCAMSDINKIPPADVQPVKRGHWYDNTYRYVGELDAYFIQACCSCCGRYSDRIDQYSQIMSNETCSHCGADR